MKKYMLYVGMLLVLASLVLGACPDSNIVGGETYTCTFTECFALSVYVKVDPVQDVGEYVTNCNQTTNFTSNFTGNVSFDCACYDGFVFELTPVLNSVGNYSLYFNHTIRTETADPVNENSGGSSSGGGGSGGYFGERTTGFSLPPFCLNTGEVYKFYYPKEEIRIITLTSWDGIVAKLNFSNQFLNMKLHDVKSVNFDEKMFIKLYKITTKPCFNISKVKEEKIVINTIDIKTDPVLDSFIKPSVNVIEEKENVKDNSLKFFIFYIGGLLLYYFLIFLWWKKWRKKKSKSLNGTKKNDSEE